jgi:hypothetical protein
MLVRCPTDFMNSKLRNTILVLARSEIVTYSSRLSAVCDLNRVIGYASPLEVRNADIRRVEMLMIKTPLLQLSASVGVKDQPHSSMHVIAAAQV